MGAMNGMNTLCLYVKVTLMPSPGQTADTDLGVVVDPAKYAISTFTPTGSEYAIERLTGDDDAPRARASIPLASAGRSEPYNAPSCAASRNCMYWKNIIPNSIDPDNRNTRTVMLIASSTKLCPRSLFFLIIGMLFFAPALLIKVAGAIY